MTGSAEGARVVAVDGGRSGVRIADMMDGRTDVIATGPGLPLLAESDGPRRVAHAISDHLPSGSPIKVLGAGLTGVWEAQERIPALLGELRHLTGAQVVSLASDVVTSHLGALEGRPGVVAAAGTGSVTLALRGDGTAAKIDGWGYLLGDAGSGYEIGRKGLTAAMAHHDGRREAEQLWAAAQRRFGNLDGLTAHLYGSSNPAADVATFTPDVVGLGRSGDAVARSILKETVAALATAVETAAARAALEGDERVWSWTGSILGLEDVIRRPVERRLAAAEQQPLRAVTPAGTALDGAARLADPAVRRWLGPLAHTADTTQLRSGD